MAQAEPIPPCGDSIFPAYAEFDRPPRVQVWSGGALGANWIPPPCTGWTSHGFRVLTAIAATFRDNRNGILDRLGAVSALTGIRYWSVSVKAWEPLVTMATALTGPDPSSSGRLHRHEIADGKDLFYAQSDNRSSGKVSTASACWRPAGPPQLLDREHQPHQAMDGHPVRAGRVAVLPCPRPPVTDHLDILGLSRTGLGANILTGGHERSYENRAIAFYRFLAGIPTDLNRQPHLERVRPRQEF